MADSIDQELVEFLLAQGHSKERAEQIAGNHPDAVRAEFEKLKGANDAKEKTASQDESATEEKPNPTA